VARSARPLTVPAGSSAFILAPDRPGLADARSAFDESANASDALSALVARGLIPEDFLDDPRRSFALTYDTHQTTPPTLAMALALGADPVGIRRAEALAELVLSRVDPWFHCETARPPRCDPRLDRWLFARSGDQARGRASRRRLVLATRGGA
jgi:hypothetical protein